jgi:TPR repeat protein
LFVPIREPLGELVATSMKNARFLIESRMQQAALGNVQACFDLGVAYSCGTGGLDVDLVQAHRWFNLAAQRGNREAQTCRAEIAEEMTAREIAEAQRLARAWTLSTSQRAAA